MFNFIKKVIENRKTKRDRKELLYNALLTLIKDSCDFYRVQTEILEQSKKLNEDIDPEKLKEFMQNMTEFVNNPNLSNDFYKQIAKQGHKERMNKVKVVK